MLLLVGGILMVFDGSLTLLSGDRLWRGTIIPAWTAWPEILLGAIVCALAIWDMRRSKGHPKQPVYTDEDVARAEDELDAMYLREHGELPQKPPKDPAGIAQKEPPANGAAPSSRLPGL
ncbi:MAG: hypothetical protein LBM00_01035 [Deltaproteobacteria bacterium]|jgi:hypothetical protein|nr:hypothetical protein [Deltaproteobacteria bacterium]